MKMSFDIPRTGVFVTELAAALFKLQGAAVVRTASKPHVCYRCRGEIVVGERYVRQVNWLNELFKSHAWDCSLQQKTRARGWKSTFLVHQRFSYLVFAGLTLGVCLQDPTVMPRWYQRLVALLGPLRKFTAAPAWFVIHNRRLSGPFTSRQDAEAFLMFI